MRTKKFFIVLLTLITMVFQSQVYTRNDEYIVQIITRFVTLKDRYRGWSVFSSELIKALEPNERYEDFIRELKLLRDICKPGYLSSSIVKRALMLANNAEYLPSKARNALNTLEFDELQALVKAYTEIDSKKTGCPLH